MRIESAFIAEAVEIDPITRALDVRAGFLNRIRIPELPCRYDLDLAIVIQIGFDEYDQEFSLVIDVERVEDLSVFHHELFSFEIPFSLEATDGFSHHYPFAFSLPLELYDVGVHSVIIGDGDRDLAHVAFLVQVVTLDDA